MIGRQHATVDHRGRRVKLLHPHELNDRGVDPKPFKIPDVGCLPARSYIWSRLHWSYVVYLAAFMLVLFGFMALASRLGLQNSWSVGLSFMAAFMLTYPMYNTIWWRFVMPRHTQQIIDAGYCPLCAFSLEGLAADDDGCVVCPECGAAWKRSEA